MDNQRNEKWNSFPFSSNRYGFNSEGHDQVFERLIKVKQEKQNSSNFILGVNLGKNKQTENAYEDYCKGIVKFAPVADYFVINISSPNTPGLRNLQQKNDLKLLLTKVMETRNSLEGASKHIPVLLKLAPDLNDNEIKEITSVILKKECRIDGVIISNTTIERANDLQSVNKLEGGGLSGKPLVNRSTALIAKVYKLTKGKVPIVGVGGIFSGKDAFDKIVAGSSAVQLYTSMIFHGPPIVQKIKRELDELLEVNGFDSVEKAVGTKADVFVKS